MATSTSSLGKTNTSRLTLAVVCLAATLTLGVGTRLDALPVPCAAATARLAKGTFLVATRDLSDPNFREAVILIADYGPKGASGLVINRPSGATLAELLPGEEALRPRNDTIYMGGPVATDRLILLIRSPAKPPESHTLFDDVHISGSASTLRALTSMPEKAMFRSYMGYAGWGPGQLEAEVERGDWHVLSADADMIFEEPSRSIWRTLIERSSGEWTMRNREKGLDARRAAAGMVERIRIASTLAGGQIGWEERSA